jgi:hypothetical protein
MKIDTGTKRFLIGGIPVIAGILRFAPIGIEHIVFGLLLFLYIKNTEW